MIVSRAALVAAIIGALCAQPARAQLREPPASAEDVLQGVRAIDEPVRTFLPKYKYELFLVGAYTGTFGTAQRQWPMLVLGFEGLLLRPGPFDFGIYVDWQLGRADDSLARYSSAAGLEIMWRVIEDSFWDFAPLIRSAYVLDWDHPSQPLVRPGIGVQVSLLRFMALQATVDGLFSTSSAFSNGNHALIGFSIALKLGIPPLFDTWPQYAEKPVSTIDRSRAVCEDATRVCQAADKSAVRDALCEAALSALDPSRHTAGWDDPTGAFLDALQTELATGAHPALDEALKTLRLDHRSSVQGLKAYAEKLRALNESQVLNKKYSYLVTPVMIRDWLGCGSDGRANRVPNERVLFACPTSPVCERDTGVVIP